MLTLRPFATLDFPLLASWFSTLPEVVQWGGSHLSYPLTQADMADMLAQGQSSPPSRRCWMVCRDGAPVGHAQLAYDWRDGNARLGRVAIAPAKRGQGLARPMVTLMIDEAFQTPGIERLELNVYLFNTPAIRTYQALGFTMEGVRRSSTRAGAERWDTGMMGLLRGEWQTPTPAPATS
ncbi:GNAT family N-acetyltransferase [Achromobacter sp. UMC46]|uniref:GNAT family N-acetyltransferase n=1 Tax=Achromobacter sp. UMC46 TaxID=1862319 RepID=UPI00160221E5|nr:GNAT family protein [Achromobacter sp. UMC46]MBB1593010.1 acetyltransferase [Achromobacter sp. UMC46]